MITVDYINQGLNDYLGAEISIDNQIICLIGISDNLTLFIEFFHDARLIDSSPNLSIDFASFLETIESCREELLFVIQRLKNLD